MARITFEIKPWTRWWWHGSAVNKQDLTASLEAFKETGLGGVEITHIYGTKGEEDQFIEYLSPKWMEMLTHTERSPSTGVDGYALTRVEKGKTALYMRLNPEDTIVVETFKGRYE